MSTEDKLQEKSDAAEPKAKPPAVRSASGLGGLVPAGGKIKKSAAKQIAKII